jgi:uncharacterized protein YjaZ
MFYFVSMICVRASLAVFLLLGAIDVANAEDASITIVRGYEGMSRYADAATYAGPKAYADLFDRHVFQRYERECAGLGSTREISRGWLRTPINDIEALQEVLEQIKQSDVAERTLEAAEFAAQLLPGGPVTICIFAYPPDIESAGFVADVMGGAMGFVDAKGGLWLQLLPTEGWLDEIYPAVTHEYYHAVTYPDNGAAPTLLDVLISEGSADSFTAILYPDFVPEWTTALSRREQVAVWALMKADLHTTNPTTIDGWVFGDGHTVPRQAGYTIGFAIVQSWLKRHPDIPPSEWSRLSPQAILDGSGYDP